MTQKTALSWLGVPFFSWEYPEFVRTLINSFRPITLSTWNKNILKNTNSGLSWCLKILALFYRLQCVMYHGKIATWRVWWHLIPEPQLHLKTDAQVLQVTGVLVSALILPKAEGVPMFGTRSTFLCDTPLNQFFFWWFLCCISFMRRSNYESLRSFLLVAHGHLQRTCTASRRQEPREIN